MSTSNNNLLNFLQQQSLFNNSPTKNVNRKMSSRSREKRSEQLWQGSPNNGAAFTQNITAGQNFNTSASFSTGQAFNSNQNISSGANFSVGQNLPQGQNVSFQANIQDNNAKVQFNNPVQFGSTPTQPFGQVDFRVETSIPSPGKKVTQITQNSFQQNNFSNGFNTFTTNIKTNETQGLANNNYSFNTYQQEIINHPGSRLESNAQSYLENVVHYAVDSTNYARTEAMKRLEILAERVRTQLGLLNSKLQTFNAQMMSIVISEFNFVKTKVYQILEETFRENEKYCRGYISTIQTEFNEDVLKARAALQREMENIQLMKIDINKPHWESNAVFVSVQFEARVNKVVDQVKGLQVKTIQHHNNQAWQMNLKRDLLDRVILRLQKERQLAFGRGI